MQDWQQAQQSPSAGRTGPPERPSTPRGRHSRAHVSPMPPTPRKPRRHTDTTPPNRGPAQHHTRTPRSASQARQSFSSHQRRSPTSSCQTARLPDVVFLEALRKQETGKRIYGMQHQKRKDVWYFARLIPKDKYSGVRDTDLSNEHGGFAICLLCRATMQFRVGRHKMVEHVTKRHPSEHQLFLDQHNLVVTTGGSVQKVRVARSLDDELTNVAEPEKTIPIRSITPEQQKQVNTLLARWIARHFRPLVIVEDAGFVEFVFFITQELGRVEIALPNRAQLRNDIVALAVFYRKRVKEDIQRFCVYYSLTSDIWTGRDGKSYISLTIHYITDRFESRNWTLEVRELPGIHDGPAIATALNEMMQEWLLIKAYCTRLLRDGGSNMVSAAAKLGVTDMFCVAHSLHLVVAGVLIKKKQKKKADKPAAMSADMSADTSATKSASTSADESAETPAWAELVASESAEPIPEHHEDEQLSIEERADMEALRDLACDEMDEYLASAILSLERDELDAVRGVVQQFRTLASYFRKSPKGQNRLGACQVSARGIKPSEVLRVQVDCPTRWNSCWDMLQRLVVLEQSLVNFFAHLKSPEGRKEFEGMDSKLRRPKASEWLAIKCLSTLLEPFAAATTALSGQQYPTLPLVAPTLYSIRKHLSRKDLFAAHVAMAGEEAYVAETEVMMNECRTIILKLFNERFSELEHSELVWVAYLDPRVGKRMSHLSATDRQGAADGLLAAARELAQEAEGGSLHPTPIQGTLQTSFDTTLAAGSFMDDLFGPDDVPRQPSDIEKDCADEFTLYLSDIKTVRSTDDPLLWWRISASKYPHLSRLARKWLGAVATSVPSERAFSTSGNILTVKRSSLAPSLVSDLVFIASNGRVENL